ncbi:hypothetical protein RE2895_58430 [Rhodococcus erythropolis]|nr:hypothetical protein RE2895_58430 [Rhodococcus erythropolis]
MFDCLEAADGRERCHVDESAIRTQLNDAGYALVQVEPRLQGLGSTIRPDVLAWAADNDGVLVPWAVVEVKHRQVAGHSAALRQLATIRDQLGTVDHYVVIDGEWFRADRGLRTATPISGPVSPANGADGVLQDVSLATSLIQERLWNAANRRRHDGQRLDSLELFADLLPGSLSGELVARSGHTVRADRDVLWRAGRRALTAFTSQDKNTDLFVSHPAIARAVAELAGDAISGTVLDPFCGTGEFLWAAADRAVAASRSVELVGVDFSSQMIEIASSLASAAPVPARAIQGNAYSELPTDVDLVLSSPPLGLRLPTQHELLNGTSTKDGDLASIDVAIRSLRSGGRAVLQISPGVTFRANGEAYRQFLAENVRVAALIGCPRGTVPGTGTGSVLLVIDKLPPTKTFVSQLGEDWEDQLSSGGAAITAAVAHLDDKTAKAT